MSKGVTKENLMALFPPALRRDERLTALGEAAAALLEQHARETDAARLYANLDTLPEAVLDLLAYDFKVDWWDADYSIEEKRRTLKGSWKVHRTLGTKAAVETAIRAIYPKTTVEEWFEYGGEPYHFRLNIDITSDSGDAKRQKRVLDRLNYCKSLRSHNDAVRYFLYPEKAWATAGGAFTGSRETDKTVIPIPELKRPGASANPIAGAFLFGVHERDRKSVSIPSLRKAGGSAASLAAGGLTGLYRRESAHVAMPEAAKAGGSASAAAAGGIFHCYQRIRVSPGITI